MSETRHAPPTLPIGDAVRFPRCGARSNGSSTCHWWVTGLSGACYTARHAPTDGNASHQRLFYALRHQGGGMPIIRNTTIVVCGIHLVAAGGCSRSTKIIPGPTVTATTTLTTVET